MAFIIGLVPTVLYALTCILIPLFGGTPRQQNFMVCFSAGLVSVLLTFFVPGLGWNLKATFISIICGLAWGFAQYFQLSAYRHYGVSRTMPLSTGIQLAINGLAGLLVFQEWNTSQSRWCGISALILVICGAALCSWKEGISPINAQQMRKGLLNTFACGFLFGLYPAGLHYFQIPAEESVGPLGVGIMLYGFLSLLLIRPETKGEVFWQWRLLGTASAGFAWAFGNLCMLLAIDRIGVATAFALSQLSVALSTIGAIFILHESRTKRELPVLFLGILAIVASGFLLSYTQG